MKDETIGEMIRRLRKENRLTIVQLSEQSGVSHPYISQIENGRSKPSPAVLEKLAGPLGVAHSKLMVKAGHSGKFDLKESVKTTLFVKDLEEFMRLTKSFVELKDYIWGLEGANQVEKWIIETADPYRSLSLSTSFFKWPATSEYKYLYNEFLKSNIEGEEVYTRIKERGGEEGLHEERTMILDTVSFLTVFMNNLAAKIIGPGDYSQRFKHDRNDIVNFIALHDVTFYGEQVSKSDRKALIRLIAAYLHEKLPKGLSLTVSDVDGALAMNLREFKSEAPEERGNNSRED